MSRSVVVITAPAGAGIRRPRPVARHLRRHLKGIVGLVIFAAAVVGALGAPWISTYNPRVADPTNRLLPPAWAGGQPGYVLGTDQLGRDLFTRLLYGARISLAVGMLSVAISAPLGVLAGLVGGFRGGLTDEVVMRIVDSQLSIPFLLLAIAIIAVVGVSTVNTIVVLGIGGWPTYARMVRGEVLSLRAQEFVEAARAIGASDVRIVFRHILPHVMTTTTVIASFAVAHMILLESTLSFLGLGVQPPTPSWGQMLADGKSYVSLAPWLAIFPGLAIAVTVLAINFIGDWARDVLSPQTRTL
ncbi:MAG: ABC transporter permease [Armatimonadota bacterium]|nr:ABC transporter permease [Armatimonadota bacterium]